MLKRRKTVVTVLVVLIVVLGLASITPMLYSLIMGPGVKTGDLNAERAMPASTEMDGEWTVDLGDGDNPTAVGFTFNEILPAERKVTSGATQDVNGSVTVTDDTLTAGQIDVEMGDLSTDNERRDVNVRMKILHTDQFPTSTFAITEPADLSGIPDDGTPGEVSLTGDLTIHGVTNEVTDNFEVLRDGDRVVIAGDIAFNRLDFDVESPDFVAAKIAEEGEVNILLSMSKES